MALGSSTKNWESWLSQQSSEDRGKILVVAIKRLIEINEVRFREREHGFVNATEECLYWESCGEDLRR